MKSEWIRLIGAFLGATLVAGPVVSGPLLTATADPGEETVRLETASPPVGWKAFVSASMQVEVDYPPGWSVREEGVHATFDPPQGVGIHLAGIDTGGISPENFLVENALPNTRCSSSTNPHGISMRNCLDTLSGSHIAYFLLTQSQGRVQLVALMTLRGGNLQVFYAMAASVRHKAH